MIDEFPIDLVLPILELMTLGDVARCACISRKFYNFAMPMLYHTVHFRLPGRFISADKSIEKLEVFTEPTFNHLRYTKRVTVIGSWYREYGELEASAGSEHLVTPAVRMFNTLVDVCLAKMGSLHTFIWDAEIPPTQRLVSRLAHHISLTELQLRLGIDGTPYPVFYPPLYYRQYSQLHTIKLIQINSEMMLRTIGRLLSSVRLLKHFYIEVDVESRLSFASAFVHFPEQVRLPLITLYARGFTDFKDIDGSFWNVFFPNTLRYLTIEAGYLQDPHFIHTFWTPPPCFQHSLVYISTNLIDRSLIEFVASCTQLQTLIFTSCQYVSPGIEHRDIWNALKRKAAHKLKCLGMYGQGPDEAELVISREAIEAWRNECPNLDEVGFALNSEDFSIMDEVFSLKGLRILHIRAKCMSPEHQSPDTIFLKSESKANSSASSRRTDSRTPTGSKRRSNNRTITRQQVRRTTNAYVSPGEDAMRSLPQWVLRHVDAGHAPHLRIVAFDDNEPFEIKRHPLRLEKLLALVGSVTKSSLFDSPYLKWAEKY